MKAIRAIPLAAAAVMLGASMAQAQITFNGTFSFSFDGAAYTSSQTFQGLSASAGGFTATTPGTSANPAQVAWSGTSALQLVVPPGQDYGSHTLDVMVTFTNPTTGTPIFDGFLSGLVSASHDGSGVLWAPATLSGIPYTIGGFQGTFALTMNNISLSANGAAVNLNGFVDEQTYAQIPPVTGTPEPASLALIGTGLIGLAGVARRRRNK